MLSVISQTYILTAFPNLYIKQSTSFYTHTHTHAHARARTHAHTHTHENSLNISLTIKIKRHFCQPEIILRLCKILLRTELSVIGTANRRLRAGRERDMS